MLLKPLVFMWLVGLNALPFKMFLFTQIREHFNLGNMITSIFSAYAKYLVQLYIGSSLLLYFLGT